MIWITTDKAIPFWWSYTDTAFDQLVSTHSCRVVVYSGVVDSNYAHLWRPGLVDRVESLVGQRQEEVVSFLWFCSALLFQPFLELMLVVGDSFVSPSDLGFLWRTSWLFYKGSFGVHLHRILNRTLHLTILWSPILTWFMTAFLTIWCLSAMI